MTNNSQTTPNGSKTSQTSPSKPGNGSNVTKNGKLQYTVDRNAFMGLPFCEKGCGRRVRLKTNVLCSICKKEDISRRTNHKFCRVIKANGTRCNNFVKNEGDLCRKHRDSFAKVNSARLTTNTSATGNLVSHSIDKSRDYSPAKIIEILPMYYSCILGPTLNRYMNCITDDAPKKFYECEQELALTRAGAQAIIGAYSEVIEYIEANKARLLSPTHPDGTQKTEEEREKDRGTVFALQARAIKFGELMQQAMKAVVEVSEKAHNIYMKNADILDVAQLPLIVNQIIEITYNTLGDENQHLAEQLQQNIADRLRLPMDNKNEGTTRRADELMDQMASTFTFDAEAVLEHRLKLENKLEEVK